MSYLNELGLSDNLAYVIGGIFAMLALATVIVAAMRRGKEPEAHRELWQRVVSWWYMVVIFVAAVALNRTLAVIFLGFLSFLALKEFLSMIPTRRADRRVLFWAYLAIPVQFYWIHIGWYGMFIIFIPVWMFLFLPLRMIIQGETSGFLRAIGTLNWGLMTTVFCLSHAAYLLILPHQGTGIDTGVALARGINLGAGLLFLLVLLTQLNDVAQYVWGKTFGGPKIIPKVSPGKTWSGFLGGVATTTAVSAAIGPLLSPLSLPMAALGGAIIAVAGFIGDVTISALKRDLGIKDTGSTIPGHGGLLDRLDSLTYAAPVFFHFLRYFYY